MRQVSPNERTRRCWQFLRDGWPVIITLLAITWGGVLVIADAYVSAIVHREYDKRVQAEPVIAALKTDIVKINGSLEELSGNDDEIREQLRTVVTRLDTLITIQLRE